MSSLLAPNPQNLAMPRGQISFAMFGTDGVTTTGEVPLGNCLALDITPKATYKDHLTSRGPLNVLDYSAIAQLEVDLKLTPEERSRENMALAFLGNPDTQKTGGGGLVSQTGGAVTGTALVPRLDRYVDLGKRYIKPGSVVIYKAASAIARDASGQWKDTSLDVLSWIRIDYDAGIIMIMSTNNASVIEADATITVDFKYGACADPLFVQGTTPISGLLRYIGKSAVGPKHMIKLWKVQINPDSAIKMLDPANYAGLSFTGKIFIDDLSGSHSTLPFGEITELAGATSYPS